MLQLNRQCKIGQKSIWFLQKLNSLYQTLSIYSHLATEFWQYQSSIKLQKSWFLCYFVFLLQFQRISRVPLNLSFHGICGFLQIFIALFTLELNTTSCHNIFEEISHLQRFFLVTSFPLGFIQATGWKIRGDQLMEKPCS